MALAQTSSKLTPSEPDQSIEDLVRQLVHKVQEADSTPDTDAASCILAVELDGFNYTLHRSQTIEACHLSPREKEIVRLVAEGLPNKCIGAVLEISSWTVATHVHRIFSKLGVSSRAAMVARLADPRVPQQRAQSPAGQPKINSFGRGALNVQSHDT